MLALAPRSPLASPHGQEGSESQVWYPHVWCGLFSFPTGPQCRPNPRPTFRQNREASPDGCSPTRSAHPPPTSRHAASAGDRAAIECTACSVCSPHTTSRRLFEQWWVPERRHRSFGLGPNATVRASPVTYLGLPIRFLRQNIGPNTRSDLRGRAR